MTSFSYHPFLLLTNFSPYNRTWFGSPLGWLWQIMIAGQFRMTASRKISAARSTELLTVPDTTNVVYDPIFGIEYKNAHLV